MSTGAWLLHRVKIYKRIRRLDGIAAAETAGMLCHSSHFCKCTIRCKMGKVSDRRRRRTNANDHDRDRSFLCCLSVCLSVSSSVVSGGQCDGMVTPAPQFRVHSISLFRNDLPTQSHSRHYHRICFFFPLYPVTNAAAAAVVAMVYYNVMAVR